jgi:hypothetical protein
MAMARIQGRALNSRRADILAILTVDRIRILFVIEIHLLFLGTWK